MRWVLVELPALRTYVQCPICLAQTLLRRKRVVYPTHAMSCTFLKIDVSSCPYRVHVCAT
ncbi:hypothetical protein CsSME_00019725 [Camellia sinensis var. sinensis]